MTARSPTILHWLLITALVILPLRIAIADLSMGSDCNHDTAVQTAMHANGVEHDSIMNMPDMGMSTMMQSADHKNCCCCNSMNGCGNTCDMGIHLSLLIPSANFSPDFVLSNKIKILNNAIASFQQTPPYRPPLKLV